MYKRQVEYRPLRATAIDSDLALRAIDELPLLAIAAAFAAGTTTITGIDPLRSKESDRVAAVERLLGTVGIDMTAGPKSLTIAGGTPVPGHVVLQTHGDHRVVMAAAVLACAAGPLTVDSDASLDVSFPGFARALEGLRAA